MSDVILKSYTILFFQHIFIVFSNGQFCPPGEERKRALTRLMTTLFMFPLCTALFRSIETIHLNAENFNENELAISF